jgi:intergrase/recombinase
LAGWVEEWGKYRSRNGKRVEVKNPGTKKAYRFCDLVSSHVMRRTGITTMLMNGVPELVVRKISGHSPTSPAFSRYVNFVQGYMDKEVHKHHEIMEQVSAPVPC